MYLPTLVRSWHCVLERAEILEMVCEEVLQLSQCTRAGRGPTLIWVIAPEVRVTRSQFFDHLYIDLISLMTEILRPDVILGWW